MRFFAMPAKRMVRRLRFAADGASLGVQLSTRPWIRFLSLDTSELTQWRPTPAVVPSCFEFSADNRLICVGGTDGIARVYERDKTGAIAEHQLGHGIGGHVRQHVDVAFAPTTDPTRQWLAMCGYEFWLWNAHTQQYHVAPEQDDFGPVAFLPNSESVVVGRGQTVSMFALRPFSERWRANLLGGRVSAISHLAISPDGDSFVVGAGCDFAVLDSAEGMRRMEFRLAKTIAREIAFLPGTRLLAVADGSPTLRVYDTDNGRLAREYDWGIGGIHSVTFSNDGAMGTAGGDKGRVVVWDVE